MKLTFVGTGSGKTSLKRFHSSLLVEKNRTTLLIDCGDSVSRALLNSGINFNSITDIIVSHNHADHYTGLPSLITQMKLCNRTEPLKIYLYKMFAHDIWNFLNACYLFKETIAFQIDIIGFENNTQININDNLVIMPRKNSHIKKKDEVREQNIPWNSSSFLISSKDTNLVYTSDVGSSDDLSLFDDSGFGYFITETTHISVSEFDNFLLSRPNVKLYLSHIDDEDEQTIFSWHQNLPPLIKQNVIITDDGLIENL
ncbi:MAG: ribonuclease Z [Melioribacteraceae bacterium]|nr:ribonuclease Z [Melioribacteraceae bacterium]